MQGSLGPFDIVILILYCLVLIGLGLYYRRKCRTAQQFMVADRTIPAWAAGLAVMSAYTSSISYIATPGKAYDSNWHVLIFSFCIIPVAWLVCRYAVPYYRKMQLVSVYGFLEDRLGVWGRVYAALSFLLFMVGRMAVILYLVGLLIHTFVPWNIGAIIVVIGAVTIVYTLLGGMEAVIWTDVMQSVVMIVGIVFCAVVLSKEILSGPDPLIETALRADKFSLGSAELSLSSRTIWVMILYGVTENLRNLMADQNYVQKYSAVPTERAAKRSVWIAMLIYIPLTAIFLYIGTARRRGLSLFYRDRAADGPAGSDSGRDCGCGHEYGGLGPELLGHRHVAGFCQAIRQTRYRRARQSPIPAFGDRRLGRARHRLCLADDPCQKRAGRVVANLRHLRRRHPRPVSSVPAPRSPGPLAGTRGHRRQRRRDKLGYVRPRPSARVAVGRVYVRPDHHRGGGYGGPDGRGVVLGRLEPVEQVRFRQGLGASLISERRSQRSPAGPAARLWPTADGTRR